MNVLFRADASTNIGGGHIVRCMTLANELVERGHQAALMAQPEGVEVFPRLGKVFPTLVEVCETPESLQSCLREAKIDVVVFDHYEIGQALETAARSIAKVVVFDDYPSRIHDCDLLVDPTYGRTMQEYRELLPGNVEYAVGTDFALLRSEFSRMREVSLDKRIEKNAIQDVFICFGLTDYGDLTVPTVTGILDKYPDLRLHVAVGSEADCVQTLRCIAEETKNLLLQVDPVSVAKMMAEADLLIGAAGSMSWERCCLGLPSIAVPVVKNQHDIATALGSSGGALIVQPDETFLDQLITAIDSLLGNADLARSIGKVASGICDGLGAKRVADHIETIAHNKSGM